MSTVRVQMSINGQQYDLELPAETFLIDLLREHLGLTGSKECCGVGVCGACTVLLDGEPVSSCLYLAAAAHDCTIWTVEGVAQRAPALATAFAEHEGMQCGICTPGQVVSTYALLHHNPKPSDDAMRSWLAGNLCRCTGYASIRRSIEAAIEAGAGDAKL